MSRDWRRTHRCHELRAADEGREVVLNGWVSKRRDLGGVFFIDLRDRYGVTQLVVQPMDDAPERSATLLEAASRLHAEDCLSVRGVVVKRTPENVNPQRVTGEIEVRIHELEVLSTSAPLPIELGEHSQSSFELRLRHRYLDLRRPVMARNMVFRSNFNRAVRECLLDQDFLEVETPILTASTPEGARDYLVPSRIHRGHFYALPQSPQLFKQLLQVGGLDRYFQIARCFRDEDLRADRQPEFTQIDLEMSFVEEEDVWNVIESVMKAAFHSCLGQELVTPFPRLRFDEAMERFGVDKPDLRFGMELKNLSELFGKSEFKVFRGALDSGGRIGGLNAKGCSPYSRKEIDGLQEYIATFGARGLAWLKVEADGLSGPIAKFLSEEESSSLRSALEAEPGDLLLMVADKSSVVLRSLGELRVRLGEKLGLRTPGEWRFTWITDFPLFEQDEETGQWFSPQHPFTAPKDWEMKGLDENPGALTSRGYDLVLNGVELGSGSIRIHRGDVQSKVFRTLGIGEEEAKERFGFLLDAFQYGPPPHGGFAVGADRLIQLMLGLDGIQDTISFPKTSSASCPLTGAPGLVTGEPLVELGIQVVPEED